MGSQKTIIRIVRSVQKIYMLFIYARTQFCFIAVLVLEHNSKFRWYVWLNVIRNQNVGVSNFAQELDTRGFPKFFHSNVW